ncbi:uncharacterized protein LOC144440123 [Glandiceps talaboti]
MAMEKQYVVKDTHSRAITALGFHPLRREILAGCEDGFIKTWEAESGLPVMSSHEHQGWVTDFLYWSDPKLLFSSSNDGSVIAWASGGGVHDKIELGSPIYCMAINFKRHQLICGFNSVLRTYDLDENKDSGHVINLKSVTENFDHSDILRCVLCNESRIYTAGYDGKLICFDSRGLSKIFCNSKAHDAGITSLILVKDTENNTRLLTGSFDKVVKIWSQDGQLTHRLDGFLATITGLCYVPRNKTVWIASGSSVASMYDPKSGENVSDFIGTFQGEETEKYHLQLLKYFPEMNQVIGSTSRRHMMTWKYNPSGCITALQCKHNVESLTYTCKPPILIFNGGSDGDVHKWERLQSNHFMYSKETFPLTEAKSKMIQIRNIKKDSDGQQRPKTAPAKSHQPTVISHYAFNKPIIPPPNLHRHANVAHLKSIFIESLDLLLVASEDANIYMWGFDDDAVNALQHMKPEGHEELIRKYGILLPRESLLLPRRTLRNNYLNAIHNVQENDSVTNRVAGFICKNVLMGHHSVVTCMAIVPPEAGFKTTYMISGGWDRRICIWDVTRGVLHDCFRNTNPGSLDTIELACDGIILDMDYSPKRNEFAYASSDKMVYIRKFSESGRKMTLCNTLQGHDGEITQVKWNHLKNQWVTGSEDGTIRIWSEDGMNCEQILAAHGLVTALYIDQLNGCIIAGVGPNLKVYDPETYKLVQTNIGHADAIRCIIHIPDRSQYLTGSWDKTIRIWNAFKQGRVKKSRLTPEKKKKQCTVSPMANDPNYLVEDEVD